LLLFSVLIVGCFYNEAGIVTGLQQLKKYLPLLFLPIFLSVFQQKKYQNWGLWAFLIAMGVTLLFSYLTAFGIFSYKGSVDNPFVFKQHIAQNILMAFSVYLLLFMAKQYPRWRHFLITWAVLASINVGMVQGRSGYIILLLLLFLMSYQLWQWRGLLLGFLFILLVSVSVYQGSEHLSHRIQETQSQWQDYQQGKIENSLAIRLQFQQHSWQLWQQHLWLGTGTGSFAQQYAQRASEKNLFPTNNPHNEYLLIANQLGLFGLLFLGWFFYQMGRLSSRTQEYQAVASALTLTMVVGCGFNSMLLDFTESYAFIYLSAIVFARLNQTQTVAS